MYKGIELVYCPRAALRRGCEGVERALAALAQLTLPDDDAMCRAALWACRGCADWKQAEVDDVGTVCLVPLGGYDSAAVVRDLAMLGARHG